VPSAGYRARQAATAAAPAWDSAANPVIAWNIFHQGPDETDEKDMCTGLTDLRKVDNTGTREYKYIRTRRWREFQG